VSAGHVPGSEVVTRFASRHLKKATICRVAEAPCRSVEIAVQKQMPSVPGWFSYELVAVGGAAKRRITKAAVPYTWKC
jgi:hypothetical protein